MEIALSLIAHPNLSKRTGSWSQFGSLKSSIGSIDSSVSESLCHVCGSGSIIGACYETGSIALYPTLHGDKELRRGDRGHPVFQVVGNVRKYATYQGNQ